MIKANELRIGNFVKQNKKSLILDLIFTINEIYSQDVYVVKSETHQAGTFKYSELRPITLTPEIIEKCGFEHIDKYTAIWGNIFFKMSVGGTLIFYYDHHCNPKNRQLSIIYLHQLQNFIFALTGEELIYTS